MANIEIKARKVEKVRARVQATSRVFIHNDLSNAAFHFKNSITKKLADDDRTGISFEYMAWAIMLAFTFEAKINFMGWKLIEDWKEFQRFDGKVKQVLEKLAIQPDWKSRPFLSLQRMKDFRDTVAHGKPQVIEKDEVVVMTPEELDRRVDLSGEWEKACTSEFLAEADEDLDKVWKLMLDKSELSIFDTMTHGEGGISFIEKVVES